MKSFKILLLIVLALVCVPSLARAQSKGFNLDVSYGKVFLDASSADVDEMASVRLDYRSGEHFVVSNGLARTSTETAYDYQLQTSLELHLFGYQKFDPYFLAGAATHKLEAKASDDSDGFASWHAGVGLDLYFGGGNGLAFEGKLARPFDQDDGEEYVEVTAGFIFGG